jgi:hypothetical protein
MQSERARRNRAKLRGQAGMPSAACEYVIVSFALNCRRMMRQARANGGTRTVRIDTMQ